MLSLLLIASFAQGQSSHAFLWTASGGMQDLGTLGGTFSQANGINASGQVVGYSYLADGTTYHAFLWSPTVGMQDLGTRGGPNSVATAINSRGQIVGYSVTGTSGRVSYQAILWTNGVPELLGTLGGLSSDAQGINDGGVVVGGSTLDNGRYHPMMWTRTGGMKDLGTLGDGGGEADAINSSNEIVGISGVGTHLDEPFSWTSASGMQDLLPHHFYLGGTAYAINFRGNIAGWVDAASNTYPALWTAGGLKVLPTLGGANAIAIAINEKNQLVGYSGTTGGANHAFFWDQTAGMIDLGTLGGTNSEAFGINSAGQVVGYSDLP